ncbi:exodeoxyribonuclease VII large subunit [Paenibacillus massiliensis]|uniref:exodeoxyribonuclease VII large subunit n=1 Tax=Paenibacillus massiliensis TaxID=225917 RepID=UPI0004006444|nr:exodeoxyribonuclease VII large subunit [Paenibacillus massiliensis]
MGEQKIFSIKDLNRYIRMKLESDSMLSDVWIRGEISNFTHHSSGHMYFTLKDESSRIKSIMFASHNQRLPFVPKEGARVIARGNVSVYERDGQYQFYATHMQPDGIGSLYLAYEQLKKKLQEEGLFAPERKRPLPRIPAVIAVVTSPTGAAVRDILITLRRRYPQAEVHLYPVLVQGKGAAPSIVKAIETVNRLAEADVMIVGRGGGSLEELWAFNEEIVARAIYSSTIPVISAVGHETDFTIADFTADLRAATPTAAAELAVPDIRELSDQVRQFVSRMNTAVQRRARSERERLQRLQRSPVLVFPRRYMLQHAERIDGLRERLRRAVQGRARLHVEQNARLRHALERHNPREQVQGARRQLDSLRRQLEQAIRSGTKEQTARLGAHIRHLDALSPLKVMGRGYSLVYDEEERTLIKSLTDVQPGDMVKIKLSDGQLDCQVWGMKEDAKSSGEGNGA